MEEYDKGIKRTHEVFIVKSRGGNHKNDVHKLILSDDGIIVIHYADSTVSGNHKKEF